MGYPELLAKIIPPNNREYRESFSNETIIDGLNSDEQAYIEDALIDMLSHSDDLLIVDTLAYMRSKKSVTALISLLSKKHDNQLAPMIIASAIYSIDHDENMIQIAIDCFKKHKDLYFLISAFGYLKRFNTERTDSLIREFIVHPEYLVSYNAKRVLGTT